MGRLALPVLLSDFEHSDILILIDAGNGFNALRRVRWPPTACILTRGAPSANGVVWTDSAGRAFVEPKYSEHPAMFKSHPFGFVLSVLLVPLGIGIVILLVWWLMSLSTTVAFVGRDLVLEKGLLSKDRTEIDVDRIRTINVYQSFFNRMFGVGRIAIYTAGDEPEIEVAGMPRPHELRELIKGNPPQPSPG